MPAKKQPRASVPSNDELKGALKDFGSLLKDHFVAAWNSKQRKEAEKLIAKGVESSVRVVKNAVEDARAGKLDDKIRSGIMTALQKSNAELSKAKTVWTPRVAKKSAPSKKSSKKS